MSKKVTLEEMADAAQERADHHHGCAEHYREHFVDAPMFEHHVHQREVFDAQARLLRIMGTYEDKSRKFVSDLLKEHGR